MAENQKEIEERFEKIIELEDNLSGWWILNFILSIFTFFLIFNLWLFDVININIYRGLLKIGLGYSLGVFLCCLMRLVEARKIYWRKHKCRKTENDK